MPKGCPVHAGIPTGSGGEWRPARASHGPPDTNLYTWCLLFVYIMNCLLTCIAVCTTRAARANAACVSAARALELGEMVGARGSHSIEHYQAKHAFTGVQMCIPCMCVFNV